MSDLEFSSERKNRTHLSPIRPLSRSSLPPSSRTHCDSTFRDLKWYGGCRYSRDRKRGTLTISQQSFAEELVKTFRVTSIESVPLKVGVKLEEFDENEETESWPFRELVGGLMWLAISTRPDISNAVRSVARYCSAPKAVH